MELALFIWLASIVESVKIGLGVILGLCVAYSGSKVYWAVFRASTDYAEKYEPEKYKRAMEILKFKWLKGIGTIVVILGFVVAMIPTEKTLYMMAAGFGAQKVVQSETADKVLKIVNGKLDEYLVEMEKSVKEGAK